MNKVACFMCGRLVDVSCAMRFVLHDSRDKVFVQEFCCPICWLFDFWWVGLVKDGIAMIEMQREVMA